MPLCVPCVGRQFLLLKQLKIKKMEFGSFKLYGIPAEKGRKSGPPRVRFSASGAISFNLGAVVLMGLDEGDGVLFAEDKGKFYALKIDVDMALRLRKGSGDGKTKSLTCNSRQAVDGIAAAYDVEFGGRIKSVGFELQKSDVSYNGSALYEVVNRVLDAASLPLLSKNN